MTSREIDSELPRNGAAGASSGDLAAVLRGSFWTVLGTVIAQTTVLAANAVAARLLGAEEYGAYGFCLSTANLIAVMAATGSALVASRGIAAMRGGSDAGAMQRHLSRCLVVAIALAVLLATVMAGASGRLASAIFRQPRVESSLLVASLLGILLAGSLVRCSGLMGLGCFKELAFVRVIAGVTGAALLGVLCLAGSTAIALLSAVASAALTYWLVRRAFLACLSQKAWSGEGPAASRAETVGRDNTSRLLLPATAAGMVSTPVIWVCQSIIGNGQSGLRAIAIVTAVSVWLQVVMFIPNNIAQPLLPLMVSRYAARHVRADVGGLFAKGLMLIGAVTVVICLLLAGFCEPLLKLYGAGFEGQERVFILLVVAAGIQALNIPAVLLLQAYADLWQHFGFNLLWAGLMITLTAAFRVDGALGYARASIIAFAAHAVVLHLWAIFRLRSVHG